MACEFDALIIGAGPAGSTAAILLAHAGWRVALVERQPFPRRKVCGECIAATNLPLLEKLGIGITFHALAGPPLKQVALITGKHDIRADLPALEAASRPWGRALGREHLDWLLLQQAVRSGATVLQPWTVQHYEGKAGNWLCRLRSSSSAARREVRACVLIVANGSWGYECKRPHLPSDLLAFKAQFFDTGLQPGVLPVLAFSGGYGGMVISDTGTTTVACCIRRDQLARCRAQLPGALAGEAVEAYLKGCCSSVQAVLEGARRPKPWMATGPIHPGIHLGHRKEDVFLIGNAAGEAHPIIGEGISMAIQSAWLLTDMLTSQQRAQLPSEDQRRLRLAYEQSWRQLFSHRLHTAAVLAHLAMRPRLASGLLPLLRRKPDLLTYAARLCGKVSTMKAGDLLHPASG